jgi:hypothetical protein
MAFVPLPMASLADDKYRAERHEGYHLMDQFLTSNEREPKDMDAFLVFVLDTVAKNIIENPGETKFQRLKKSSKAYSVVKNVKLGSKLMDFLGFRDRVEEFEQFSVLLTSDADWLDAFREKTELIKLQWQKRKDAVRLEQKSLSARDDEKAKHKALVLNRIQEERKQREAKAMNK